MHTKTIGKLLEEERVGHQLSLENLSKKTRIRLEYLQALEANDFASLPAAAYVKGYIKSYAQIFGFDPKPLIAVLRRDYKESARGKLVPREFIKPVIKKRRSTTSITVMMAVLMGIFVSLVGYVVYQWYSLNQPPDLVVVQPTDQSSVAPQLTVEGRTSFDALVTVNDQPVALQPDGSFSTQVLLPNAGITTLTVEAADNRGRVNRIQRTVYVQY